MSTNILVPALGESVREATIARWIKSVGDSVAQDEPLVELETDKVTLEVNAPTAGFLSTIKATEGSTVAVGDVIGIISADAGAITTQKPSELTHESVPHDKQPTLPLSTPRPSPAAQKLASERDIDLSHLKGTGRDNVITKEDVMRFGGQSPSQKQELVPSSHSPSPTPTTSPISSIPRDSKPYEERIRMTRLRQRIAERLMQSQKSTATLTTFNEIDMSQVMAARENLKESFEKKHGVRLGFMSFFIKAAIVALKEIPAVNAEIDGDDIIYKNHYDIGVAVGTSHGLVVPVVRNADQKSFAEIEKDIASLATKARDSKLSMEDMSGGTFTISNGGVYGSLMSTPILNPPQSGILGMHKVEKRPVVLEDQIVIRPMMYVALSYDHRIIDGTESVTFLKRIKEGIENPERILLEV